MERKFKRISERQVSFFRIFEGESESERFECFSCPRERFVFIEEREA
jgi:hypothetical protein